MKKIRLFFKNEHGNVAVMFAISITVLFGMAALVIDGGRLFHEKRILQNAVDAAALGGAQGLVTSQTDAASIAKDFANKNSFYIDDSNLTITSETIKVMKTTTVPMTFAKVVGINEASVSAAAKAKVSLLKSATGVAPIAIEKSLLPGEPNYSTETPLKCEEEKYSPGNCGYLDLSTNGASGLADAIVNGSTMPISEGSIVDTETGEKWGPVKTAFETLMANDANKTQCQSPDTADKSCDRVIIVPIINSWEGINGKKPVQIIGFAAYWVANIENSTKTITGNFIRMVSSGEIGGTGPGTLYGVKLVE